MLEIAASPPPKRGKNETNLVGIYTPSFKSTVRIVTLLTELLKEKNAMLMNFYFKKFCALVLSKPNANNVFHAH